MSENSEVKLKQLRAARGYTKSSITRLYLFTSNTQEVQLANIFSLQTKQARIVELFKEYEAYTKQILALDEEDQGQDILEVESKYFHILTVLNEAMKQKATPASDSNAFKAKLPKIDIKPFTDIYTSRAYQFERSDEEEPTVADFLAFLEKRALALENVEPSTSGKALKAAVNITTTPRTGSCLRCKSEQHKLFNCSKFKVLPYAERIQFCKDNALCTVCLNNHPGKCKYHFRYKICKNQSHNTALHDDTASEQPVSLMSNVSSVYSQGKAIRTKWQRSTSEGNIGFCFSDIHSNQQGY